MPTKPGIYIYKDVNGRLLYVGKAVNLKNRVRSYFQPAEKLGTKTAALVSQISTIEYIEVQSEVEALLLESRLIKKYKPPYNIASKDDKSPYYIHLSKGEFPTIIINHEPIGSLAGPFLNSLLAKRILKQFRRIAPYCTAPRPVKRPCLHSHLGLCNPCPGDPSTTKDSYRKNIIRLRHLLQGNFIRVKSQLKNSMDAASKNLEYEHAKNLRDQLHSLEYLLNSPVMPEEYLVNPNLVADKRQQAMDSLKNELIKHSSLNLKHLNRIEMYDIANLSGKDATAAMTVAVNGEPNSKYYRHFTIKTKDTPDDVAMMSEVLERRLKRTDWPTPDLIVLDGGKSQLSAVTKIPLSLFKERGWGEVPIIALAKKEEIITVPQNDDYIELKLSFDEPGLKLLQQLRDEAHRFSRRLHHKHRAKSLYS